MSDLVKMLTGGGSTEQSSQQQSTSQSNQGSQQTSVNSSDASNSSNSNTSGNSAGVSTTSDYTAPALSGLSGGLADALTKALAGFSSQTANAGNPIGTAAPTTQAGPTAQETQLLGQLPGAAAGANTSAASDYIKNVLGGNYMPGSPGGNPFLAAAITAAQRPTLDNLTQTLTRDLPGRFTANGQLIQPNTGANGGSSAFDRASALAFQSAANTSTDIAAKIGSDAYGTGVAQQENAAGLAPGLDSAQVDNTIKSLQASALPRLIQQNGLDQGLQLFQQQTANLLDFLKTIGTVQAPTLGTNSASTSTNSGTSTSSGNSSSSGASQGTSFGESSSQSTGSSQGTASNYKGIIPAIFKPV